MVLLAAPSGGEVGVPEIALNQLPGGLHHRALRTATEEPDRLQDHQESHDLATKPPPPPLPAGLKDHIETKQLGTMPECSENVQ